MFVCSSVVGLRIILRSSVRPLMYGSITKCFCVRSTDSKNVLTSCSGLGVVFFLYSFMEKHDIKVFSKPVTTLQQQFPSLKHRPTMEEQTNIIYKIPCKDCSWSYIGETGRSLKTRQLEHLGNVEHCKKGSNAAKHAWKISGRFRQF